MATRSRVGQSDLFGATQSRLPAGLRYEPDIITAAEEQELLAGIVTLPLHEAQYKAVHREAAHRELRCQVDFSSNVLETAPELVPFLEGLRTKVADWLGPQAGSVRTGSRRRISAQHCARLASRRATIRRDRRRIARRRMPHALSPLSGAQDQARGVFALELEPRSAYVLHGDARWGWQHSIPTTKALRYSITFRTMRGIDRSKPDSVNAEIAEQE
jgi:hypothetical protein